jgi:hypothetical protein
MWIVRNQWLQLRHCERERSNPGAAKKEMDCFVASAPRNDVDDDAPPTTVILREGGVSSTPRILVSIVNVSEYWMPACAGMTGGYASAFSRHTAPEFCKFICPQKRRGRREDRVRAAPAVSCARIDIEDAHEHTGSAETLRPSLRDGFTAYFVLSPVRPELVCHRHPQEA